MKLETSEADREWVRKRVDYIRSQGGPFILDDRVYCDFLTLLAEVERLRAVPPAPPLPAEVEEMRKTLDYWAGMVAVGGHLEAAGVLRSAASLLSRWPGGFFAGLSEEQKKAALKYRGPENFGEPDAPLLPEPPHE